MLRKPAICNPSYGSEELTGDSWIGYGREIFRGSDWRVPLNVRNAWGNGQGMPVNANPDGTGAVIRIPFSQRAGGMAAGVLFLICFIAHRPAVI